MTRTPLIPRTRRATALRVQEAGRFDKLLRPGVYNPDSVAKAADAPPRRARLVATIRTADGSIDREATALNLVKQVLARDGRPLIEFGR